MITAFANNMNIQYNPCLVSVEHLLVPVLNSMRQDQQMSFLCLASTWNSHRINPCRILVSIISGTVRARGKVRRQWPQITLGVTAFIRALFFCHASLKEDVKQDLFHSCQQRVTLISSPTPSFDTREGFGGEWSKARDHMNLTFKRSSLTYSDSPWQCGGIATFLFALMDEEMFKARCQLCCTTCWIGDNTQLQWYFSHFYFTTNNITQIFLLDHTWMKLQLIFFLYTLFTSLSILVTEQAMSLNVVCLRPRAVVVKHHSILIYLK